jgi:pyrimidine-nucleoside phosphorylase
MAQFRVTLSVGRVSGSPWESGEGGKNVRAVDLIIKKRNGQALLPKEIAFLVNGYTRDEIPDYQMASFLMAVFFRGMKGSETKVLTRSMIESGRTLDLSSLPGPTADKHSTGGVGDKVSLVVVPLAAACGLYLAKMSGRGLGHTGGTIDKLESIPGFRTDLQVEELLMQVRAIGCAIIAQTPDLTPADGKIYALRDVTGTVDSLPLIASSVMSKKIASGAQNILIDVKCGWGAFMHDLPQAKLLARLMVKLGRDMGRNVGCVISPMEEPLGLAVGNSVEVMEAIDTLKGDGPPDFAQAVRHLTAELLKLAGLVKTLPEAEKKVETTLQSGVALQRFTRMVEAQHGNPHVVEDRSLLPLGRFQAIMPAFMDGFLAEVDALQVGHAAMLLGAGRQKKGDRVDPGAGMILTRKVGEKVLRGEPLVTLYSSQRNGLERAVHFLQGAFSISGERVSPSPLFLGKVGLNG